MINTIQPRSNLPISRLLVDPLDSSTYYLRALVKNAKTGTLLATVALPVISGRLYGATWQTPADSSGQGFYITVTTQVFTDSGYTTPASTYYEEFEPFFIYDQFNLVQSLGTQIAALLGDGGSSDVNYKKIKLIVDEARDKVIKAIPDKAEKTNLYPVILGIQNLADSIGKIPTEHEEGQKFDVAPIISTIETSTKNVLEAIEANKPGETEKINLEPVIEAIKGTNITEMQPLLTKTIAALDAVEKSNAGVTKDFNSALAETKNMLYEMLFKILTALTPSSIRSSMPTLNQFGKVTKTRE